MAPMQLFKLRYHDHVTGAVLPNMQRRVEFFFQYWFFLFTSRHATHDTYYLKSHRTIINKVRLQVDGNYKYAKGRIKQFLSDDELFANTDIVIKTINRTPAKKAVNSINRFVTSSWATATPKKITSQLDKLQQWLDTNYSSHVAECCKQLLVKDVPLNTSDMEALKKLVNCFVIELFHKGYNKKFISEVPYNMFDRDGFPYERTRSDFPTAAAYDGYKTSVWQTLSLEDQIESLRRLLDRPNQTRYLIYKITNINFRTAPVTILGVQFYSPHLNPKVQNPRIAPFIQETFTLKPDAPYEVSSWCNACVSVAGLHEDKMYGIGYEKVRSALAILNLSLSASGLVSPFHVLTTNENFDQLWGSSDAIFAGVRRYDTISQDQRDVMQYYEQLRLPGDEDVRKLLTVFYEEKSSMNGYKPDRLWMILEATFVHEKAEDELKDLFLAAYKVYLKHNLAPNWELYFAQAVNPRFNAANEEDYFILSRKELSDLGWLELIPDQTRLGANRLRAKLQRLKLMLPNVPFIHTQIDHVERYFTNRQEYNSNLKKWIDYLLTEVYVQRNLRAHSDMSDELFLLKQHETVKLIEIVINVFVHQHLKYRTRKPVAEVIAKIKAIAAPL